MQAFDAESRTVLQVHQALNTKGESFPNWWKEADTLRFIHEFGFKPEPTAEKIKDHFRWLTTFPGAKLSEQAKFLIETGTVYQLGRDVSYRPNVYIIFNKLNSIADNLNAIIEALLHLLVLVREKMLVPYHVERWNLFLDCNGSNELASGKNILGKLYEAIRTNFPQTLERIILLGGGLLESFGAQFDPAQSRGLKDRVTILEDRNDPGLNQLIGKEQLEYKYGGAVPNSTVFWPPQSTSNRKTVSQAALEKRKLFFFKMHDAAATTTTQSEYRAATESNTRSLSPQFASTAPDFNRPSGNSGLGRPGSMFY